MIVPSPGVGLDATRIRRFITQFILVVLINVPSISFGLAMGWVSLESGGKEGEESGVALVGAAAATFLAGALAMPVAARAIAAGRKLAMMATSAAFILCWSLKLYGGDWSVVVARAAAGLGGTAAWVIPPMLAVEMCCTEVRGAAAVALVMAHNVGFLLMYLASDYEIPHRTVLLCCLGLSVLHFIAYIFVPESPAYLAANGKHKEARAALAWCRGYPSDSTTCELDAELKALPEPDLEPVSPFRLAKDMLSDVRRRKAFIIALVAVVGQEMCGVLTLLQFAERVFSLAREEGAVEEGGRKAASDAVVLGAVQLVASTMALYLVEKIGRRPLLVWGAVATGLCLGGGAGAVWAGSGAGALAALATAVFADSAGLQPAPYALLAEMFTYQYRGCASLLVTAASDLGNAVEIVVFPWIVHAGGLALALAVAAALTLLLAAFAAATVPETMNRSPEQIYEALCPGMVDDPSGIQVNKREDKKDVLKTDEEVKEDRNKGDNKTDMNDADAHMKNVLQMNEITLLEDCKNDVEGKNYSEDNNGDSCETKQKTIDKNHISAKIEHNNPNANSKYYEAGDDVTLTISLQNTNKDASQVDDDVILLNDHSVIVSSQTTQEDKNTHEIEERDAEPLEATKEKALQKAPEPFAAQKGLPCKATGISNKIKFTMSMP